MKPKYPGSELAWLTPLWALAGGFLAYQSFAHGSLGFGFLYGSLAVFSVLVWFDFKEVALPLIVYFSLALIAIIASQVTTGFSWEKSLRGCVAAFSIWAVWEWKQDLHH